MSIQFIAVLDHEHLENTLFLTTFAKSLAKLGDRKGLIIHGDSPYTDRIIQTGVMREEARLRAIKDLNKRLIGLFADQGIPTIGIHGFQKGFIKKEEDKLNLDRKALNAHHASPNILLSNLVERNGDPEHVPLAEFTRSVSRQLDDAEIILFSKDEKYEILVSESRKELSWDNLPEGFADQALPGEFQNFDHPVKLTTATDFSHWPELKKVTKIS